MTPGTGRRRDRHGPGGSTRERQPAPQRGRAAPTGAARRPAAPPGGARSGSGPRGPRLARPPVGRRRRRVLVALVVTALVAGGAWVVFASPLLGARAVVVTGAVELTADEVRAAAAVRLGTPLLRLDTAVIEARVEQLPPVGDAEVRRSPSGTVVVRVSERAAVLAAPAADGVHLVDAAGTDFTTAPAAPPGVPELRVSGLTDGRLSAAVAVLTGLPEPLRGQVVALDVRSPADVILELADGRTVQWGAADQGARKAAVLAVLLSQPGEVYDVTTPDLPTIS